ncbi:hypothetical protein JI752_016700 [Lysobacter sp. MMG2]|uniref:hypothetical protein n=1 Tax=Lysobacter sp. MMG2 TaxID=2801338 RepID=UPI001C250CA6|nr:hypothetical protein [Lysobacter sp. MMG2]MBU8977788.1 hypothetical protein [Lysobacter sp. MMG2]
MKHALILLVLIASLIGCGTVPDAEALQALAQAGRIALTTSKAGDLPADRWPTDISSLDPKRVYIAKEGLYVVTSTFFVEERGLFVPRASDFVPQVGADPSYVAIGKGVFSYRIRG